MPTRPPFGEYRLSLRFVCRPDFKWWFSSGGFGYNILFMVTHRERGRGVLHAVSIFILEMRKNSAPQRRKKPAKFWEKFVMFFGDAPLRFYRIRSLFNFFRKPL